MDHISLTLTPQEVRTILTGLQFKMHADQKQIHICEERGELASSIHFLDEYRKANALYDSISERAGFHR